MNHKLKYSTAMQCFTVLVVFFTLWQHCIHVFWNNSSKRQKRQNIHLFMTRVSLQKVTLRFKIEERRKWATIWKSSVGIPQFIEERMNTSFQLQYHKRGSGEFTFDFQTAGLKVKVKLTAVHLRFGEYWKNRHTRSTASGGRRFWKTWYDNT